MLWISDGLMDGEARYCHSSVAHEPISKSVKCNENPMETGVPRTNNGVKREEKHGIDVLVSQTYEVDTDLFPFEKFAGGGVHHEQEPHNYMFTNNSIVERVNEGVDMVVPCFIPIAEVELSGKGADLYTDKTITEIELKDICIDEGVPSPDKMLVEIDRIDHKTITDFPCSDSDGECDLTQKEADNGISSLDGLITLGQLLSREDKESEKLIPRGLLKGGGEFDSTNEIVNDFTDGEVTSDKQVLIDFASARSQVSSEESTSTLASANEESNINHDMVLHFSSKVDGGSITLNFDVHAPTTSSRDDRDENTDGHRSVQTLVEPGLQVGVLEGANTSSRSILTQHGNGETSFSGMSLFSGPIAPSGSIPYSGSISLRSDSSTTSTRSFAFPILHSEWTSSPVKMAKADRKLYRKHRGWLQNLLCCKY